MKLNVKVIILSLLDAVLIPIRRVAVDKEVKDREWKVLIIEGKTGRVKDGSMKRP